MKQVRGWFPKEPVTAGPHGTPKPWWWQPTWSMGAFLGEVSLLNLIVPVSTFGLPVFLANMWLCFLIGGALADRIGKKRNYKSLAPSPRWKTDMRRFVIFPLATVELAIGVVYFSMDNWVYVLTRCQTGNACTFFQLAPVVLLIIGAICLVSLAILVIRERVRGADE